mmetsp:Transcript_21189/g.31583  ORF Transcript_21189/g.31583 Transcript_21189/m.31583 type:complete len:278 (+) Transcript_21189:96-929(+)
MGHSCGSLLQLILSSQSESESLPRAANVLISYNNKPVKDAIPAFEELVTPAALRLTSPSGADGPVLRSTIRQIQDRLKDAEALGSTGLFPPIYNNEILPFLKQTLSPLDQLPGLFERIANGVSDFSPTTLQILDGARAGYKIPKTLLVKFNDDSIDETEKIGSVLRAIDSSVETLQIEGTHVTPCIQDFLFETPLDVLRPPMLQNVRDETRKSLLAETKDLAGRILKFIDMSLDDNIVYVESTVTTPPPDLTPRVVGGQTIVPLNVSDDNSDFTPYL